MTSRTLYARALRRHAGLCNDASWLLGCPCIALSWAPSLWLLVAVVVLPVQLTMVALSVAYHREAELLDREGDARGGKSLTMACDCDSGGNRQVEFVESPGQLVSFDHAQPGDIVRVYTDGSLMTDAAWRLVVERHDGACSCSTWVRTERLDDAEVEVARRFTAKVRAADPGAFRLAP